MSRWSNAQPPVTVDVGDVFSASEQALVLGSDDEHPNVAVATTDATQTFCAHPIRFSLWNNRRMTLIRCANFFAAMRCR